MKKKYTRQNSHTLKKNVLNIIIVNSKWFKQVKL